MPRRDDGVDPALLDIANQIVEYHDHDGGPSVPCWVYVYPPTDEFQVRAEIVRMAAWLGSPGRDVEFTSVSLADVCWEAIDDSGMYDELVRQEREADGDAAAQAEVHRSVGQLLRLPPSLTERVARRMPTPPGRWACVLYRSGALYPGYRTSALLDDLKLRTGVRIPVVLLYPGTIEGNYGLRFMGKTEPAYGYRAMIVARGERREKR
ncbi:MAG: BREX protein BrxB domain-containing protein [Acidimicrobiales bacterium]